MNFDRRYAALLAQRPQSDGVVGAGGQALGGVLVQKDGSNVVRVAFQLHGLGTGARVPEAYAVLRRATGEDCALTVHGKTVY